MAYRVLAVPTRPRRLLRGLLNLALNWLVWTAVAFGGAAIWGRWMLRRSNTRGSGGSS